MCTFAESDTQDALVCVGILSVFLTESHQFWLRLILLFALTAKEKEGSYTCHTNAYLKISSFYFKFILQLNNGTPGTTTWMYRQVLQKNYSVFRVQKSVLWQGGENLEGYSCQDVFTGCFIFGISTCVKVSNTMKPLPCIPFLKCWRTRYLSMLSTVHTHLLKAD